MKPGRGDRPQPPQLLPGLLSYCPAHRIPRHPYFSGPVVLRNCLGAGQWLAGTLGPTQSHQLSARLLAWLAPALVAGGGGRVRGSSESGLGCYGDNCANDTQVPITISSSTEHFLITAAPTEPPHTVWHSPILQSGSPRPRGAEFKFEHRAGLFPRWQNRIWGVMVQPDCPPTEPLLCILSFALRLEGHSRAPPTWPAHLLQLWGS